MGQAPNILGIGASERWGTTVVPTSCTECATWVAKPTAAALRMRDQRLELPEHGRVEKVVLSTFCCEIDFEALDPNCSNCVGHTPGSGEYFDAERADNQANVTLQGVNVSVQ